MYFIKHFFEIFYISYIILTYIFKKNEESSDIEDSIKSIQFCNHVKDAREKEGRLIPLSIESQINDATKNIIGELAVSSDISLEDARKRFTKLSGLEVKEKSLS